MVADGAGLGTTAGLGIAATGAVAGEACLGSVRGCAMGAGASGNTPLMTGSCLLLRSWLRRVTVVGSSTSSANL